MSTYLADQGDGEIAFPISLYLSLEQGRHVDLRTVSRIGLSLSEIIEQVAASIDPFTVIKIELISGSEGSFDFNAIIKAVSNFHKNVEAGLSKKPSLKYLVAYLAFRILNHATDWSQDKVMDWLFSNDAPAHVQAMPENKKRELAAVIVNNLRPEVAKVPTETLYTILRRDSNILAVGVSSVPRKTPQIMISQTEFKAHSGTAPIQDGEYRQQIRRESVILVSPVLMESERRWRFQGNNGEFGAPMKDKEFLFSALSGEAELRLRQGVRMDVDVEYVEQATDGIWEIKSRSIVKVHGWGEPPMQSDLFSPGS